MYLRNIFKTKAGLVVATVGSLAFGLYNLYILGRNDQVDQTVNIARSNEGDEILLHPYTQDSAFEKMKKTGTLGVKWYDEIR